MRFNRDNLYVQVLDALRKLILSGKWRSGDFLPNENDLAKQYGVSSGTMRKALDILEAEHLLERMQGRGTRISFPKPWEDLSLPAKRVLELLGSPELLPDGKVQVKRVDADGAEFVTIYGPKDFDALSEAAREISACLVRKPPVLSAERAGAADKRAESHANGAHTNGHAAQ